LMTEGELKASKSNPDFVLLPDAFGVSKALESIADRFGIESIEFSLLETSMEPTMRSEPDSASPDL
jgi:hypothetical protein